MSGLSAEVLRWDCVVWRNGLIGRPEPTRVRKLLANRAELKKMEEFMTNPNAQLVPWSCCSGYSGDEERG